MARAYARCVVLLIDLVVVLACLPPRPVHAAAAPPAVVMGRGAMQAEYQDEQPSKTTKKPASSKKELTTKAARLAFIQKAQIWTPTNIAEMDLKAGPQGPGAFQPNETVICDYVEKATLPGTSQKFDCEVSKGDVVKVRYGAKNGKVEGAVVASRLLWALGFGADRLYPVTVTCRGCSPDPWNERERVSGEQVFDPAAIERKPAGHEMKSENKGGWAWPELDLVDERQGGAPRAQRDALKLLAVFMQTPITSKRTSVFCACPRRGKTAARATSPS